MGSFYQDAIVFQIVYSVFNGDMKKIPAVIQILLSYQWQCTLNVTCETQTEHAISHSQGDDEDENKNNWDLL